MEELQGLQEPTGPQTPNPEQLRELSERFRPKRVSTLQALRKIVRASDFLDHETLAQLDNGAPVRFKTSVQQKD